MTNELDAGRAIEILEDDELEQENAAMGEQMDEERAAFVREDRYIVLKRKHLANLPNDLQYRLKPALDEAAQLMPTMECVVVESDWPEHPIVWQMIEARMNGASLPVGVPDGLLTRIDSAIKAFTSGRASMHVPPEPDDVDMVLGECWKLVNALIAAPTVKAEQCMPCGGWGVIAAEPGDPVTACEHCNKAPSLPAAGSADLTASQCACGDEYPANSYGAGFMAANNGICENCDAANSCASEPMPAAGSAVESWSDQLQREFPNSEPEYWPDSITIPAMGREIRELRTALSAQQSAPERVSVPRDFVLFLLGEAMRDGVFFDSRHPHHRGLYWWRKELRALLNGGEA